jgi:hypothetical protein
MLYVGSTKDINRRLGQHEHSLRRGRHPVKALQKLYTEEPGIEAFFFLTESEFEARQLEEWLIDRFASSGRLLNRNQIGFRGMSGLSHSAETRRKISQLKLGRKLPAEAIAKRSITNSIPVEIDGQHYSSLKDAGEILGFSSSFLIHRLNSGNFPTWKYLDGRDKKVVGKSTVKQPVSVSGVRYRSMNAACQALGRSKAWVDKRRDS